MQVYMNEVDQKMNQVLKTVTKPTIVKGLIHLLLILYAARLAPMLPEPAMKLFDNAYFKLFVFSLILWTAQFSPSISILIALSFMITVNYTSNKPLWEFLENVEAEPVQAEPVQTEPVQAVPVQAVLEPVAGMTQPQQAPVESQGCYPIRRYDVTNIVGFSTPTNEDFGEAPPQLP